ncbi:MAG: phage major capsid protein [Cyclobacteriaceae bacterium]|nr:MAG: phage major capsid protein [Cyclobacteriaceae bacterium]
MKTAIEAINELGDTVSERLKVIDELQEEIRSLKDGAFTVTGRKSFGNVAIEKLKEVGLNAQLGKNERKRIVLKDAGTFTTGNVTPVGSNAIPFSLSDAERGLTRVQRRRLYLMDVANVSRTDKMYVQWAEQQNLEGSVGPTVQGTRKNQVDFDWVEKSQKVEKLTAFIKTSREALDDLDGLQNEIGVDLRERVLQKTEDDLLYGDGVSPNILGVMSAAVPFSASGFTGSIDSPTRHDVVRVGIAQIAKANFQPNAIMINPVDAALMDLTKSTADEHYLTPSFVSANGELISGVRVIESNGIDVGDFLIGDFSKFNVRIRSEFGIEIGYEDDDFTKNLVTILGEIRLASYVKQNHSGAFMAGAFTTALAALAAS